MFQLQNRTGEMARLTGTLSAWVVKFLDAGVVRASKHPLDSSSTCKRPLAPEHRHVVRPVALRHDQSCRRSLNEESRLNCAI